MQIQPLSLKAKQIHTEEKEQRAIITTEEKEQCKKFDTLQDTAEQFTSITQMIDEAMQQQTEIDYGNLFSLIRPWLASLLTPPATQEIFTATAHLPTYAGLLHSTLHLLQKFLAAEESLAQEMKDYLNNNTNDVIIRNAQADKQYELIKQGAALCLTVHNIVASLIKQSSLHTLEIPRSATLIIDIYVALYSLLDLLPFEGENLNKKLLGLQSAVMEGQFSIKKLENMASIIALLRDTHITQSFALSTSFDSSYYIALYLLAEKLYYYNMLVKDCTENERDLLHAISQYFFKNLDINYQHGQQYLASLDNLVEYMAMDIQIQASLNHLLIAIAQDLLNQKQLTLEPKPQTVETAALTDDPNFIKFEKLCKEILQDMKIHDVNGTYNDRMFKDILLSSGNTLIKLMQFFNYAFPSQEVNKLLFNKLPDFTKFLVQKENTAPLYKQSRQHLATTLIKIIPTLAAVKDVQLTTHYANIVAPLLAVAKTAVPAGTEDELYAVLNEHLIEQSSYWEGLYLVTIYYLLLARSYNQVIKNEEFPLSCYLPFMVKLATHIVDSIATIKNMRFDKKNRVLQLGSKMLEIETQGYQNKRQFVISILEKDERKCETATLALQFLQQYTAILTKILTPHNQHALHQSGRRSIQSKHK